MTCFRRKDVEFRGVRRISRRARNGRSCGVSLADLADDFELGLFLSVSETHVVLVPSRRTHTSSFFDKRIDDRDSDAVQSAEKR